MTFILLVLSVCMFAWVAYKTWEVATDPRAADLIGRDAELEELLELANKKRIVLSSLKETELDHRTGKVADADFEELRDHGMREGTELMRRLDEMRGELTCYDKIDRDVAQLAGPLEQSVRPAAGRSQGEVFGLDEGDSTGLSPAALLRKQLADGAQPCPSCDELVAADDKFCRACGTGVERACPSCGSSLSTNDRFCRECGTSLQ